MLTSLRLKLFLVLLAVTAVAVAGTWLFMERAFESGFVRLVEARQRERVETVSELLAREYEEAGGWQRLAGDPRRWVRILLQARGARGREPRWARRLQREPPGDWPPPRREGRHDEEEHHGDGGHHDEDGRRGRTPLEFRMMLLDADRRVLVGRPERVSALELFPIEVSGSTAGYLGVLPGPAINEVADVDFVTEQKRRFVAIAGVMVLLAAALALPLAGGMTRRIRRIADGARSLAAGHYDTRVEAGARDELGRLASDFNELAAALDAARRSRRQWVADVSHELRTPLAVLRAELEAMQDGVRELDARAVEVLHGEVLRLGRLVDDLFDLSLADLGALSYRKERVDPLDLLHGDVSGLSPEFDARGLRVQWDRSRDPVARVHVDPGRLSQLFNNLLTNTLRYTDRGGVLAIEASIDGPDLVVDLKDSAPGVPEDHLARLFDRFHRVEDSRSREHGGAGLGLAICSSIVAAHGGTIEARPSPLGGVWIRVRLPVAP